MSRNELSEMIALGERLNAAGEPAVLATLFAANGSTYRPLGSMMLGGPSSALTAGGGCGGSIEVLVERFTPDHLAFLHQLAAVHESDEASTAACVIDTSTSPTIAVRRLLLSADHNETTFDRELERLRHRAMHAGRSMH